MASELPKFLQRISLGKLGFSRDSQVSDSGVTANEAPKLGPDWADSAVAKTMPISSPAPELAPVAPLFATAHAASTAAAAGIFRSRAPELVGKSASAKGLGPIAEATVEALDRAKSPVISDRLRGKPRLRKASAEGKSPRRATPADLPVPEPEFRILSLPRLAQGGRWKTEAMRSYSMPLLLWFTRGQGRITLAGVTRGFGPHNCVYLPPGTMHGFEASAQIFGSAVFFPLGTDLGLPDAPVHLRFRDAGGHHELTQMIDTMQRELEGNKTARARALQHQAGLMSVWLERQVEAQNGASALTETGARRLSAAYTSLVEKRFREGLAVADFATELGVTPTHLTRSCNAACGRSAHDLLSDRIFYEARKLLAEGKAPVQEIARGLGFTSAAYFTRAFQKATGQTPTAFRAVAAN